MEKLTIFTNHYFPENFRINALSEEFANSFRVNVVTQVPNYPSGRFFKGYSIFKKRQEKVNNIEITRLPVIPRGNNVIMLSLNYISYIVSSFFYRLFSNRKTDHVLVYITSPIFISYAGLAFAKKNNVKSTLYLLDLWPGSLISMLNIKNKYIIKKLENMCIKIYKRFDNIIVSSYGFIEVLIDYGIAEEKISYIPQHADEMLKEAIKIKPITDKLKVVFTGNIGKAQGLDVLVETALILKSENFKDVLFTIVGDGRYKKQLEKNIETKNVKDYFNLTGRVGYNEIKEILALNHFGFVSLSDDETLSRTLPAKVQSYMAYGIPILASANNEVPNIIKKAQCGISVVANDANELAKTIKNCVELSQDDLLKMGKNGFMYSKDNFNLNDVSKEIVKIMKEGI